ncbi:glycosyl transferase family 2 [Opitutaceae bacterium EW11]|nr:glycosyl transferase family 2 [Opitutaceae bacterium EW11]
MAGAGTARLCFGFGSLAPGGAPRKLLSVACIDAWISPAEDLERGFITPPAGSRPSTFWWWLNTHVSKEGITRDLEEFRAKGIGGVVLINTANGFGGGAIPPGPKFLSAEWLALYRHALEEADRLGLEVGVNLSSGWCMGGPWIRPEASGRWYLQATQVVTGPAHVSEVLPLPGNRSGYENARQLFVKNYVNLPLDQLDYRDTAVVAFPEPDGDASRLGAERLASLPAKSNRLDGSSHLRAQDVMTPPAVPWSAQDGDHPVRASEVLDLTSKLRPDGRLEWDAPPGRWVILRTGHRMTGARTAYALPGADGLEVDWLSEAGVEAQFEHLGRVLLDAAGPFAGRTLRYFHEDSFEDGFPNWTATLLEKFKRYRGYDPTPYLPVFAGRIVGSAETSDRFLYDYRRTVADCMADAHYGRLAELCHDAGLQVQNEAAGPSWSGTMCMDALENLGRSDQPMGEFWQDNYRFVQDGQNQVCKSVASAAHLYGRKTATAEAFTTFSHWSDAPSDLKPIADRAFCEGINRLVFHTSTASRPEDGKPGYEYGAGTHFNPNVTWWPMAGAWVSYLARCQHLLQSGLFVADVLYYNGDGAPNLVEPKHVPADLGPGFDYDVCNSEVLLTRLSVRDGRLVLPDGMSYRALVLPATDRMPLEVARKLRSLVHDGATVIGPRPRRIPGLSGIPSSDTEVAAIGAEVWARCDGRAQTRTTFGAGRVFCGRRVGDVLADDGVPPDFSFPPAEGSLDFLHRRTPDADLYFVVNRRDTDAVVTCTFRVTGRTPELWDPVTGERREAHGFSADARGTAVRMTFAPHQSWFVVFRKPLLSGSPAAHAPQTEWRPVRVMPGPWTVRFDPRWGGPGEVVWPGLIDWRLSPDEGVRYYSGTATYRILFDRPRELTPGAPVVLDLGVVKNLASVRLNGVALGVLWTAPWRIDVTPALKPSANVLEIEVVNLWPNRLIGDKYLPANQRFTRTNIPLKDDAAVLPSGLLGPVTLLSGQP